MGKRTWGRIFCIVFVSLMPLGALAQEPSATCAVSGDRQRVTCKVCWYYPAGQTCTDTFVTGVPPGDPRSPDFDRIFTAVAVYQLHKNFSELQAQNAALKQELQKQSDAQKADTDHKVAETAKEVARKLSGLGQEFVRDPAFYSALVARLLDDPAIYEAVKVKLLAEYPQILQKRN
ncbi:MAG: hypothetical protein AAB403_06880 [Planctomycetota bacterium]